MKKGTWAKISVFFSVTKLAIMSTILTLKAPLHQFDSMWIMLYLIWVLSFGDILIKIYRGKFNY